MNIKVFVLVITFILVTGCATQRAYKGADQSSDELSIISPISPLAFEHIWGLSVGIVEVDGVVLDVFKSGSFEVLPGRHEITVMLSDSSTYWRSAPIFITIDTEAGKKYIVDYRGAGRKIFVIEEASGIVIYDQAELNE